MKQLAYNLQLFKEIFFPRRCAVCNVEIDTGLVCSDCRKAFALHKVKLYGADRKSWQALNNIGQPVAAEDIFDRVELLYRYEGAFKEALHKLKFDREARLLPLLKEEADLALTGSFRGLCRHYDVLISIPTSVERRRLRGFDVPQELFAELGKQSLREALLERKRSTAPLYTMAEEERKAELEGCFAVKQKEQLLDKRILLCDDIYTTGSTMKEAAQLLLKSGAKSVGVLAFCASKDNWS